MASERVKFIIQDQLFTGLKGLREELAEKVTDDDFCCIVIAACSKLVELYSSDLITIGPVTKVELIGILRDVLNKN